LADVAPYLKNGHVSIPATSARPFSESLIDQVTAFPGAVRDDRVDALSQMLDFHFLGEPDTTKQSKARKEDGSHYLQGFEL